MEKEQLLAMLETLKKIGDKNRPRGSMAEDLILAWRAFTQMGGDKAASVIAKLTEHQAVIEKFMAPADPDAEIMYLQQGEVEEAVKYVHENDGWLIVLVMVDCSVAILGRSVMKESNLGIVFSRAWPGMRQHLEEQLREQPAPGPNDELYHEILNG